MATMNEKTSSPSEQEIDDFVVSQADDDTVWDEPVLVRKAKAENLSLSPSLATRAAFFARIHHETDVESWLERIIRERLDLEEAAFVDLKRELAAHRQSPPRDL